MQDDPRIAGLEDAVRALRLVATQQDARIAVAEARIADARDDADRLRAVELGLARLRAALMVAVPVLTIGIPLLVRLLGSEQ